MRDRHFSQDDLAHLLEEAIASVSHIVPLPKLSIELGSFEFGDNGLVAHIVGGGSDVWMKVSAREISLNPGWPQFMALLRHRARSAVRTWENNLMHDIGMQK